MPNCVRRKITKRLVNALAREGKYGVYWDAALPGFGVRVYGTGRLTYVVQSRGPDGSRRAALGRHVDLTPAQARVSAAEAITRIKAGEEPVPKIEDSANEPTVEVLAKKYLDTHVSVECKASSAGRYRQLLRNHILPALGEVLVADVGREHVAALHHALRDRPTTANGALFVLLKMFSLAEAWGLRPKNSNPCRSVKKYRRHYRERFLSRAEYRHVGRVLEEADAWPPAVAAIRLLMLTGCRSEEIASLKWDDVDRGAGELRLRDTKTGPRYVPLTPTALELLDGIERIAGNPWVFPGKKPGSRVARLANHWEVLREKADLPGVRLHDLRHSYASRALAIGESLSMIGKLLGHAKVETTARYAHLAIDAEKAAAARVAGSIEAQILPEKCRAGDGGRINTGAGTVAGAPDPAVGPPETV